MMALHDAAVFFAAMKERGGETQGNFACGHCGITLQESITGCRKVADEFYCSDCYFSEMGDALEAYPISAPKVHRA